MKQLSRKVVYKTPFLSVYEDEVELTNGKFIPDYTVIQKPNIVAIVATDPAGKIILLKEFKYAAGKELWSLPAGHLKTHEDPVTAAQRELLEETGYAGKATYVGTMYEYPTKDLHTVSVVRITDAQKQQEKVLEETEASTEHLMSLQQLNNLITKGELCISSSLSALRMCGM